MLLPAAPFTTSNLNEVATQDAGASVVEDDRAKSLVRGSTVDIGAVGAAHIVLIALRAGDALLGDFECITSGEGAEAAAEITDLAGTRAGLAALDNENVVRLVAAVGDIGCGTARAQGRRFRSSRSRATGFEGIVVAMGERRPTSIGGFLYAYGFTFGKVAEETTVEVVLASSREEFVGFLDFGLVVHGAILVESHGEIPVLGQVGNLWIA